MITFWGTGGLWRVCAHKCVIGGWRDTDHPFRISFHPACVPCLCSSFWKHLGWRDQCQGRITSPGPWHNALKWHQSPNSLLNNLGTGALGKGVLGQQICWFFIPSVTLHQPSPLPTKISQPGSSGSSFPLLKFTNPFIYLFIYLHNNLYPNRPNVELGTQQQTRCELCLQGVSAQRQRQTEKWKIPRWDKVWGKGVQGSWEDRGDSWPGGVQVKEPCLALNSPHQCSFH